MRSSPFRLSTVVLSCLILFHVPASAQDVCDGVSRVNESGLQSVVISSGLIGEPLFVTAPPGDADRIFIVERNGSVWIRNRGDDASTRSLFLDLSGVISMASGEMGLLGMAFDPDFDGDPVNGNGDLYVNYTEIVDFINVFTVVARYTVSPVNPDVADPSSEVRILRIAQPQTNHNGGHMEFGPDGFLYINSGDGGGANDIHGTCGNGQDLSNLLGKILRIDVRGVDPGAGASDCGLAGNYGIPSDNPFADGSGGDCDEIWDYGLRNPWRSSFDVASGDHYVADVGQGCWEELNWVPSSSAGGRNYGWRQMEGNQCFDPADAGNCDPSPVACFGSPACDDPSLTDPVLDYSHFDTGNPCSVTGGYVYRGCRMTGIQGTYFYGDYCAGFVRTFEIVGGAATNPQDRTSEIDPGGALMFGLTSFGTDARGEIYIVDQSGVVTKIVPLFTDMEVSGTGTSPSDQLRMNRNGNWTWEDLPYASDIPVDFYRVYRGVPGGTFTCIHSTVDPGWIEGDLQEPAPGDLQAYVVTAVNASGQETSSGDPERTLTSPCAAP